MESRRFVINLASRPDRRREMQKQLTRVGWTAEFVDAIRPVDEGGFPSIGARGCFLSHMEVLRRGRGSNVILMEDDLSFVPNFPNLWADAVKKLPDDWSLFYPAHDVPEGPLDPSLALQCTHMMVLRDTIVERVLGELQTIMARPGGHRMGGPMHVDGAYSTIRAQNPGIKTYAALLGWQRSSRSDIMGSTLDRVPLLRPVLNFARDVKNSIRS